MLIDMHGALNGCGHFKERLDLLVIPSLKAFTWDDVMLIHDGDEMGLGWKIAHILPILTKPYLAGLWQRRKKPSLE